MHGDSRLAARRCRRDGAAAADHIDGMLEPTAANETVGELIRMRSQSEVIEWEPPHPGHASGGVDALPEVTGRVEGVVIRTPGHEISRIRHLEDELAEPRRRHGETHVR